jgi:hypothetical protein
MTLFSVEVKSQNVVQLGQNYFSAGIPSDNFQFYSVTGRQRSMNWCWAACVQMVLNYDGLFVSQEDIVMRCFGTLVDRTGGDREMFTALSGWGYNRYGGVSTIYANSFPTNANEIQAFLAANKPLIVGLNQPNSTIGHAYVLTAMNYSVSYDYYGNATIWPDKIVLRDPWPTNPSRLEMSWIEFTSRLHTCYKVWLN